MTIRPVLHNDGWINLLMGLGKRGTDKTESTEFEREIILTDEELSSLYNGEGMAANIIDAVPDDMTRAGWKIENDEKGLIEKEMKRLKATKALNKALKYARLYRGAIIAIVTERGELDQPLPANPGNIIQLRVYSAARIPLTTIDIIDDPKSKYFEEVEEFPILTRRGTPIKIHASRCLIFKGELIADYDELDLEYEFWGLSFFQRIWPRIKHYAAVERAIANLMLEFNIGKFTLSNLAQILSQNTEQAKELIYNRMEIINASKSLLNAVLLGEGESYDRDSANLSGVADIIDRMMINVSMVSRMPVTKIFGRSAAGMNATGEGDLTNYYDTVSTKQDQDFLPELQRLVDIIGGIVYGTKGKEYTVTFNSLWEPSEKEIAEIEKIRSETHNGDIASGVIDEDESREIRYPDLKKREIDLENEEEEEEEAPPEETPPEETPPEEEEEK